MNAEGLVSEARRLDGEARGHKREIALRRRLLHDARTRQAEVERQCARLGIAVTYETHPDTSGEGDHPWPQQTPSSTSRR